MRLTFKFVKALASKHGYVVEHTGRHEDPYELFSNEKMTGVTVSGSLVEVYSELHNRLQNEGIITKDGL